MGTKTLGELEAAVSHLLSKFHIETVGRGPRNITTTIRARTVFVRLEGVLTIVEEQLIGRSPSDQHGVSMVRELRSQLAQRARNTLLNGLAQTIGQPPLR